MRKYFTIFALILIVLALIGGLLLASSPPPIRDDLRNHPTKILKNDFSKCSQTVEI